MQVWKLLDFQRIGSTWRSRRYGRSTADLNMTLILILAVVVLSVVALVWLRRCSGSAKVRITTTDGRSFGTQGGSNLFLEFRKAGIDLPSTCGGQGSCAQCRCRVLRGGGRITEQERPYFSQEEIKARWRLACRLTAQRSLLVEIQDSANGHGKRRA